MRRQEFKNTLTQGIDTALMDTARYAPLIGMAANDLQKFLEDWREKVQDKDSIEEFLMFVNYIYPMLKNNGAGATDLIRGWANENQQLAQQARQMVRPVVPAQPVMQPAQPVMQPAQPVMQPAQPVMQPAQPAMQPAQPMMKPAQPAMQPVQPAQLQVMLI